jgi:hypothetical protein
MRHALYIVAAALSAAGLLAGASGANAAGAVAFGSCSIYGDANATTVRKAEDAAVARCAKTSKTECLLVAKETKGCIAVVTLVPAACGHFVAQNSDSGMARNLAMTRCGHLHPSGCQFADEVCF